MDYHDTSYWLDWLRRIPRETPLQNPEEIEAAEREALAQEDDDDRAWALYFLVERLVLGQQWGKAEAVAQSIELPNEKADALRVIAVGLLDIERERALRNLSLAESAVLAGTTPCVWRKADVLAKIGRTLLEVGEKERASNLWEHAAEVARLGEATETGHETVNCSSVLWQIAEYLAIMGDLEKAKSRAENIKGNSKRAQAIDTVTRSASGDLEAGNKWE